MGRVQKIMVGLFVLAAVPLANVANAASVNDFGAAEPFPVTEIVIGDEKFSYDFQVAQDGDYMMSISDFGALAGDPFATMDTLALIVTSGVDFLGAVNAAGGTDSFVFMAMPDVTYTATVRAVVDGLGAFGAGVALVPIPAAGLLFASALAGLAVVGRRRRS